MSDAMKQAGYGQSTAIGAAGGGIVGALTTLFQENPSIRKALKNTAVGVAGGAVLGATSEAAGLMDKKVTVEGSSGQTGMTEEIPGPPDPSPQAEPGNKAMSPIIAALSGLAPGVGPAIHGAVANIEEGPGAAIGQSALSGAASLTGPTLVAHNQLLKATEAAKHGHLRPMSGKARIAMPLLSILGATGAAVAGNELRGQ